MRDAQTQPLSIPEQQSIPLDIQSPSNTETPASTSDVKFLVKTFQISGNTSIQTNVLTNLLNSLTNKEITFASLQDAANRIRQYYIDHGYPLVVSYIPAQEIESGVVKIAVLEGKYGQVLIQNNGQFKSTVTASISANNKVYDGNTDATLIASLNGMISGDNVNVITSGNFLTNTAGRDKTVNINMPTLSGMDAANYFISQYNLTTSADIIPLSDFVATISEKQKICIIYIAKFMGQ